MLLPALKIITIFLGAAFALLGLVTSFKNLNGRVTIYGKIALVGFLLSLVTGASIQVLEYHEKHQESLQREAQTAAILANINRAVTPLNRVMFSFETRIWNQPAESKTYLARINAAIAETKKTEFRTRDFMGVAYDKNGDLVSVTGLKSSFLYSLISNEWIESLAGGVRLHVYLFKKPRQLYPSDEPGLEALASLGYPDLHWSVEAVPTEHDDVDFTERVGLVFYTAKQEFGLKADYVAEDADYWVGTGKISSVFDLAGAQAWVFLEDKTTPGFPGHDLEYLDLSFGRGMEIRLNDDEFTRHSSGRAGVAYEYRFPNSVEDLKKRFENDAPTSGAHPTFHPIIPVL